VAGRNDCYTAPTSAADRRNQPPERRLAYFPAAFCGGARSPARAPACSVVREGGFSVVVASTGLELVDLAKRFGSVPALDGCSLTVRPGRVLGLLGPNGAGKTTAMRCVFGLVTPDRGEVRWAGAPVDQAVRLRFGYMPEERGLYSQMGVRAQLEYLARLSGLDRGTARAGVESWLGRLGLADRGADRLGTLSHGNQQRVQLAAALVHDPVALVLDEPFAGLDPLGVEALAGVIRDLARDGTAVLFSSHQLDLVEDVCEDVVVLDHGRVVLQGELQRLRAASLRRYLAVRFRGRERWTPSIADARVLAAEPGSTRLELANGVDLETLAALARSAGDVTRFSLEPPSLSDLFHEAVGR
jgi:ABC-2 type transport system ATP-binding protein